jgi:hypothetical protein
VITYRLVPSWLVLLGIAPAWAFTLFGSFQDKTNPVVFLHKLKHQATAPLLPIGKLPLAPGPRARGSTNA